MHSHAALICHSYARSSTDGQIWISGAIVGALDLLWERVSERPISERFCECLDLLWERWTFREQLWESE